jgi:hypothetical protein
MVGILVHGKNHLILSGPRESPPAHDNCCGRLRGFAVAAANRAIRHACERLE